MPTDKNHQDERTRLRNIVRVRPAPSDIARPGPGEESVWDYPRPPTLEPLTQHLEVIFAGITVARTTQALRVIETAGAPVYYFPPDDVRMDLLSRSEQTSFCEWKGTARYWSLSAGGRSAEDAAWSYPEPDEGFGTIADYIAFYPAKMDTCMIDGESAKPQPGGFYGGWITKRILGPYKGAPGSENW